MGPWDESRLESLIHSWGEVYSISRPEVGRWVAQRKDTRETLTAETAEELDAAILRDYTAKRFPLDFGRTRR
jgi:hypothetical protein